VTDMSLRDLHLCFEGAVPAVIATASSDGTPNVTYLSRVRVVDDFRIAVSNQFFSKTTRNLTENPRASILVIDPVSYDEYRMTVVYERTERRGPVFERLREDVDAVAAVSGMQDVFKLRSADIYRVSQIDRVRAASAAAPNPAADPGPRITTNPQGLGELTARLSRCPDLDAIVTTTVDGLAELLGIGHSLLMLLDEPGQRLYTIASHGYPAEGVGSEVAVGDGIVGMVAARATAIRVGNMRQMVKYGMGVRRAFEQRGEISPGREIEVPGLADAESRMAVPALALGQLVGVLTVESHQQVAYTESDEAILSVVASVVAGAIEAERANAIVDDAGLPGSGTPRARRAGTGLTHVRFFEVDGSTFLDGNYLIKGVAGRILWSLLGHYEREQRTDFTNKEVRLDPSLELPEFRDNLDSRLLLLKRRLDEQAAPIRIEKTGRGRFRLDVGTELRLDGVAAPGA
jgi:adenylate cyclase